MIRLPSPLAATVAVACGLLAWQPLARAQDLDVDGLERQLETVANQAIPRTVLVRAYTNDGRMGAGSGAIISPDGFILTCSHVVEIGQRLEVSTPDGKTYPAQCVGRNKRQDFALVKIDATGLQAFELGDSDTVHAGDWVVALGHPGGPYNDLQPAFAAGRVRALHRKLPVGFMEKYYNDAIMTDCPIYAGDSGGPLVNLDGKLVGINGAIVMINEMAFAIPLNQILRDLDGLKAGQVAEGVPPGPEAWKDMQDIVSPEDYQKMMARAFKNLPKLFGGQDSPLGQLFNDPNSPLKNLFGGNGGNGEMPDLSKLFGEDSPFKDLFGGNGGNGQMPDLSKLFGEDSPLKGLFGGNGADPEQMQEMLKQLFGGQSPFGGEQDPGTQAPAAPARPHGVMGVRAAQPRPGLTGVLIDQVAPGGAGEQSGLKKGDVIVQVGSTPIRGIDDLKASLSNKAPGDRVHVTVERAAFVDAAVVQQRVELDVTLGQ
jgi:S1-C subfamily serine protease